MDPELQALIDDMHRKLVELTAELDSMDAALAELIAEDAE